MIVCHSIMYHIAYKSFPAAGSTSITDSYQFGRSQNRQQTPDFVCI